MSLSERLQPTGRTAMMVTSVYGPLKNGSSRSKRSSIRNSAALRPKEDIGGLRALIERKDATHLRWLLGILATTAIALVITPVRTLLD